MLGSMKFTRIPRAHVAEVLESAPPPAGGLPAKYLVTLTAEERDQLQALAHAGRIAARPLKHAWILLKAGASPRGSPTPRRWRLKWPPGSAAATRSGRPSTGSLRRRMPASSS